MSDEEACQLPVLIDAATLETAGMSTWMTDAGGFDVLAGLDVWPSAAAGSFIASPAAGQLVRVTV